MANINPGEANRILDLSLPTGGTVYLALFTVAPDNTTGAGGTEVSGGSYARQAMTTAAASGGSKTNNATITFPTATADWGQIVAYAVYDASTAGTMRWHRTFSTSGPDERRTVLTGDEYKVNSGSLTFSIS